MTPLTNKDQIVTAIRREVSKYVDQPFANDDHFVDKIKIVSDDLTAIVLAVEKEFSVKLRREQYRSISNVREFANAIEAAVVRPKL